MKRILSVMMSVLAFAVAPALVHAQTVPPECIGLQTSDWVDIQQSSMRVVGTASVVADPVASDGSAAKEQGNDNNWYVQYSFPANQAGTWHVYAHARCDSGAVSGAAFTMGIYNGATVSYPAYKTVTIESGAADGSYHMYDLGIVNLNTNSTFFMCPNDSAITSAVYLDRIVLVRDATPPECVGVDPSKWIDFQQSALTVVGTATIVDDPASSDGSAIKELGNDPNWYIQYHVPTERVGTWHVYAHARCDSTAAAGPVIDLGVFNLGTSKFQAYKTVKVTDGAGDGSYHIYDLGIMDLNTDSILFMCPSENAAASAVYLDRVVFVKPEISTTPSECVGLQPGDWMDIQQGSINVFGTANTMADLAASDAVAAKERGDDPSWYVQYYFPESQAGVWHVYAHARCDTSASAGDAVKLGIYDINAQSYLSQKTIKIEDGVADGSYHPYDLGLINISSNPNAYFFMSPCDGRYITGSWLDRLVMVRDTIPSECANLKTTDWVDIQQSSMRIVGTASVVGDPVASDKMAAKEQMSDPGWNIQYHFPESLTGAWHVYAHARCESSATSGPAFDLGVYDVSTSSYINLKTVTVESGAADGSYHMYDLGVMNLSPNAYFFMFPSGGTVASTASLDRIVLVRIDQADSITDLSDYPDNTDVVLGTPAVVTTAPGTFTDGSVYIEDPDRSAGIRCVFGSGVAQPGVSDRVIVGGSMATDSTGQRYINVKSVAIKETGNALGALGAGIKSITQAKPSMSCLLGRTWGKVTYVAEDNTYYYIDDGSGITDASGVATGLRVKLDGLNTPDTDVPAVNDYVTKTGIITKQAVQNSTSTVTIPVLQSLKCTLNILEPQFKLVYLDSEVIVVTDLEAPDNPDKQVAMLLGSFKDWCVQCPVPSGRWHCYATVKSDGTGSGPAFMLGIYDPSYRLPDGSIDLTYPASKTVMLEDGANDGQYHVYDLGSQQLKAGDFFWFAAMGEANSPNVYVDKVTLVSEN